MNHHTSKSDGNKQDTESNETDPFGKTHKKLPFIIGFVATYIFSELLVEVMKSQNYENSKLFEIGIKLFSYSLFALIVFRIIDNKNST